MSRHFLLFVSLAVVGCIPTAGTQPPTQKTVTSAANSSHVPEASPNPAAAPAPALAPEPATPPPPTPAPEPAATPAPAPEKPQVTRANFDKIEHEMPLEKIEAIVGGKGTKVGRLEMPLRNAKQGSLANFTGLGVWLKWVGTEGTLYVQFTEAEPGPMSKNYGCLFETFENGKQRIDWKRSTASGTVQRN
jgi:hypothetical protein